MYALSWVRTRGRQIARSAMDDTVILERAVATPDGRGGSTDAYTALATLPCRLDKSGQAASEATAGGMSATAPFTFRLPYPLVDTAGSPATIVPATDRFVHEGHVYELTDVLAGTLAYETDVPATRIT